MNVSAPSDADLAAQVRLLVFRLRRRLHRESSGDLTPSQGSALSSISRLGPLTLGELSQVENVRPPTLTKVVAALEQLELVARHVDPSDRRVSRVEITKEGSALLTRNRAATDAYLERRLASLPTSDRAALAKAVDILERLLEADE